MSILSKHQHVGAYTVTFHVNDGEYAECYRVKDASGKNYFMKLYNYAKLHRTQFDEDGNVLELEISKLLKHPNISMYHDSDEMIINGQKFAYIIYDYISGETVHARVTREQTCSIYDAKEIVIGVLNGLKYLHMLERPILHNEITIKNVMLDMSLGKNSVKLIDFGYSRFLDQNNKSFRKDGLNPFYMAPEAFNGIFSIHTDLYSVGALFYHLLFGLPPHFQNITSDDDIEAIIIAKTRPLKIVNNYRSIDDDLLAIIAKALAPSVDDRFQNADDFIKALNGEIKINTIIKQAKVAEDKEHLNRNIKKGNGFADVAGMDSLKEQLQSDVIDLLENPEQAKALGLYIPNGLLFYGPPGCGKTFFAEKFAEQVGCNYQYIKCSDVASPYIHGGQEKIAAIFDEARKNAPTILFFDEIDAMIKDRNKHTNVSEAGEVNEFLAQLNNCGQDGVIVIGATNKPNEIDEAALRAGRLEMKYYIPHPDHQTRKTLFELELKKRKTDFGINYSKLADMTENYISADIRLSIDTAARLVFRRKLECITMEVLEEAITNTKPSISLEIIKKHEAIRDAFEGIGTTSSSQRRKIGF